MRSLFITFEGIDGSGKSTHLRLAAERLLERGTPLCVTKEPGGTPLGEELRSVFLDHRWKAMDGTVETLLVFASRRQQLLEVIDPALAAGRHVLCDRFTDSTLAYQGYGRGLEERTILAVDRVATGGRRPDLTLLFDLPAAEARRRGTSGGTGSRRRGASDRLDEEQLAFYERVRQGYLELARSDPRRIRLIDSAGPREATQRQVQEVLSSVGLESGERVGGDAG